jgi:hypothetical protein
VKAIPHREHGQCNQQPSININQTTTIVDEKISLLTASSIWTPQSSIINVSRVEITNGFKQGTSRSLYNLAALRNSVSIISTKAQC